MSEDTEKAGSVEEFLPRRFGDLCGVQWRIDLGILPSSPSSSEDLRRVTTYYRRRYASLRRRLLVDLHMAKDGINSPDLSVDNALSQNPGHIVQRTCGVEQATAIRSLQIGGNLAICPPGMFVLYLSTLGFAAVKGKELLLEAINDLVNLDSSTTETSECSSQKLRPRTLMRMQMPRRA